MRALLAALLLTGCLDMDYGLQTGDELARPPAEDAADTGGWADTGWAEADAPGDEADPDAGDVGGSDGSTPNPEPGGSRDNPRPPVPGDLVLNELMINPAEVSDASGEWVELWNRSDAWVDVEGYRLADDNVDDYTFDPTDEDSLIVAPGGFLVVCASRDAAANGGVPCDAEYFYQTWGGGFALANSEDEVVLVDPDGVEVDRVAYGAGFVRTGAALGVDPSRATVGGNDAADGWCAQSARLASGDLGTPGQENDRCW